MLLRLRSLLVYHNATARELAEDIGIAQNTLSKKMISGEHWDLKKEVVPILRFFKRRGGDYTVDYVFEELFEALKD